MKIKWFVAVISVLSSIFPFSAFGYLDSKRAIQKISQQPVFECRAEYQSLDPTYVFSDESRLSLRKQIFAQTQADATTIFLNKIGAEVSGEKDLFANANLLTGENKTVRVVDLDCTSRPAK